MRAEVLMQHRVGHRRVRRSGTGRSWNAVERLVSSDVNRIASEVFEWCACQMLAMSDGTP